MLQPSVWRARRRYQPIGSPGISLPVRTRRDQSLICLPLAARFGSPLTEKLVGGALPERLIRTRSSFPHPLRLNIILSLVSFLRTFDSFSVFSYNQHTIFC